MAVGCKLSHRLGTEGRPEGQDVVVAHESATDGRHGQPPQITILVVITVHPRTVLTPQRNLLQQIVKLVETGVSLGIIQRQQTWLPPDALPTLLPQGHHGLVGFHRHAGALLTVVLHGSDGSPKRVNDTTIMIM